MCGGTAELDECGVCNGNGIPSGFCDCDDHVLDCAGVCGGTSQLDDCDICDDITSNDNACFGCLDPEAENYCDSCTIDDDSCEYLSETPELFLANQSSLQAFYYFHFAELDGIALDLDDWIGSFNGDVCVGASQWRGEYTEVPVFGDNGSPETEGYMTAPNVPSFKIYDAASGEYFNAVASTEFGWYNLATPFIELLSAVTLPPDCAGVTGGEAFLDDCGVCSGGTSGHEANSDQDCNGDCFGGAYRDSCFECVGGNTGAVEGWAKDCMDLCFGTAYLDDCNVCSAGMTGHQPNSDMDCYGECFGDAFTDDCFECVGGNTGAVEDWAKDCTGLCFGEAFLDDCQVCSGGTSSHEVNSDQDCNGDCFGTAFLDDCEVCSAGQTNHEANSDIDCDGVCFGSAYLDNCDVCVGLSGHIPNSDEDCNGDCFGIAFLDDCDQCVGGETGQLADWAKDCAGECFGDADYDDCDICSGGISGHEANADKDCNGDCFGIAFLDDCDQCVGGETGQLADWAKDCAGECFGDADYDDCDICSGGTSGHEANADKDCNGDCFGDAYTDECFECVGGNTGAEDGWAMDCSGLCFGDADYDDCDVCSGGMTGLQPNADKDCNGDCFGEAYRDNCFECVGGNTGSEEGWAMDCFGLCFGSAFLDDCDVCSGGFSGHEANSDMDCSGDCFGDAFVNDCGCVEGLTGAEADWCYGCLDPEASNYCEECTIADTCLYIDIPELFNTNLSLDQAFYFFQDATLDYETIIEGDWIGAFKGDVCVGAAPWTGEWTEVPVFGNDGGPGTEGYMQTGDIPEFMVYNASENMYYDATASADVPWANFGVEFIELLYAFTAPPDCAGVPGGDAYFDDCQICSGGTSGHEANADKDCYGDCFGDAYLDDCFECVGGNSGAIDGWAKDCFGLCFGDADYDDCNVCAGGMTGLEPNADKDCFGDCFGDAYIDDCFECVGGNSGAIDGWEKDCFGLCFGDADYDDCEVCSGGMTGLEPNADKDCNGDCFGEAYLDDCFECVGGNSGAEDGWAKDCFGLCFGDADYDDCEVCSGGMTGLEPNADKDCNGVCFGEAFENECGCVEGATGQSSDWCYGCVDPDAENFCSFCTVDDGSCLFEVIIEPGDDSVIITIGSIFIEIPAGNPAFQGGLNQQEIIIQIFEWIFGGGRSLTLGQILDNIPSEFEYGENSVYAITPFGLVFQNPITISIPYESYTGDEAAMSVLALDNDTDESWSLVPGSICEDGTCMFNTMSFGLFIVVHDVPGVEDCAGVLDGTAYLDNCGFCVGGNTGLSPCGIDCAGTWGGSAYADECLVCDGNPENDNGCFGCTDPDAQNFDPDATIDDDSCFWQISTTYEFHEGNNLMGFTGIPDDPSVEVVLEPIYDQVISIFGAGSSAVPHPVIHGNWLGNLTQFESTDGYWFRVNQDVSLEVTALPTEYGTVHDLHSGNNLISYTGVEGASIADALPDDLEPIIDLIIGAGVSAVHHPQNPDIWLGNLQSFSRLKGYWFRIQQDAELVYVTEGLARSSSQNTGILAELNGFDSAQSTKQAFYYIEDIETSLQLDENMWIIAYNGDVIVGKGQWSDEYTSIPVMGYDGSEITEGYCNNGDEPTFKLYNDLTGELYELISEGTEGFLNNQVFFLDRLKKNESVSEELSASPAYPNPFNPVTTLTYSLPVMDHVKIAIYDMSGRWVETLVNEHQTAGYHQVMWNGNDQASGIYFARVESAGQVTSQKLILVK